MVPTLRNMDSKYLFAFWCTSNSKTTRTSTQLNRRQSGVQAA